MHLELEFGYCSNEAKKNKYTNFQLKASIKNNLKIRLYRALYLQQQLVIFYCLDLKVLCCLKFLLLESIFSSASYVSLSSS